MKKFEIEDTDNLADALLQMLEKDTGQNIFTMRITGTKDDALETIIIFEDKSVLMGKIIVQDIDDNGQFGFRVQANYI